MTSLMDAQTIADIRPVLASYVAGSITARSALSRLKRITEYADGPAWVLNAVDGFDTAAGKLKRLQSELKSYDRRRKAKPPAESLIDTVRRIFDEQYVGGVRPETALRWKFTIDGQGPWTLREIIKANDLSEVEAWLPVVVDGPLGVGDSFAIDLGAGGVTHWQRTA